MKAERLTDSVTLYCGDCLEILWDLGEGSIGAVVTDPPYSSGGAFRGDRAASTLTKYVRSSSHDGQQNFGGDSRDQRGFLAWSAMWLSACRRATLPGGPLCCFIDWRQLPVMTDSVQAGGWIWRNLCTWWKPGIRMQKGRFSGSAEYLVFGTNGPNDSDGERSPQNVFSCPPVPGDDKEHIAEKPLPVMAWAVSVAPKNSIILDPFGGSGTTAIAAMAAGHSCILIEQDPAYCDVIRRRVAAANGEAPGSLFKSCVPSLFEG